MKLTKKEKEICDKYKQRDERGLVRCHECPLAIDNRMELCYATADGRTWSKKVKRYE